MSVRTKYLVQGALIAALYAAISLVIKLPPVFGIEIRLSEMLAILPIYYPAAPAGLFIGCFITNLFGGNIIDIIFGSLATLIGAILTCKLKERKIYAYLAPVITNSIFVPFILKYAYGIDIPIIISFMAVFISEGISVFILGTLLEKFVIKRMKK